MIEPVVLTELRDDDSEVLFRWINDRELVLLSGAFEPVARAAHDAWFASVRTRSDTLIRAIRRDDGGELIGTCQLHAIDRTHGSAELRIRIGERTAWGSGHGTAALRLLLAEGFGALRLHRIWLQVLASNERARRAYRRVGFREEGVLRDGARIEGRYEDLVLMAILAGDAAA